MKESRGLPSHLSKNEAQGLAPQEPIAQYEVGSMQNFNYLILNWDEKKAVIVDPQKEIEGILADLENHGFALTHVLLTHTHFDHTAGLEGLVARDPSIEIWAGPLDLHRLSRRLIQQGNIKSAEDETMIALGQLQIRAMHTPGHSAGEVSYFLAPQKQVKLPYLFTGDTIFIRDCGRTDFPDGSNEQMFHSIQKIKTLPLNTVFLVGHHYAKECATTLETELHTSAPFKVKGVTELAALP